MSLTVYLGVRPWSGAEIWIDPEIDQGFGLSNTLGFAGFPSGEAYKVGDKTPYLKLPRLFLRQTIDLGGERQSVDADANQLAGTESANRIVLTVGKFGVPDIFDTNKYAHDPRNDFLNWTLIDTGTFDYAGRRLGLHLLRGGRVVSRGTGPGARASFEPFQGSQQPGARPHLHPIPDHRRDRAPLQPGWPAGRGPRHWLL